MAEKLNEQIRTEAGPVPVRRETPLARIQAVPWLIVIVLLAATAWLSWRAFFYNESDAIGSALLTFEKQNSLNVFASRFEVVAESTNSTSVGPITIARAKQADIIPATVTYQVELGSVGRDRLSWNADTETLSVVLPKLKVSRPNLDEARKKSYSEGVWISREASRKLNAQNSAQAEQKALAFAQNPEVLALAREAAKSAIRMNLTAPLKAAGYGSAKVTVRFDGEAAAQ